MNSKKPDQLSFSVHLYNPYPARKVSDQGVWKGYFHLSMLFPSFSIDLLHTCTCHLSMDWLTISAIVMITGLFKIASHVTNQCLLLIPKKKKEENSICGHCRGDLTLVMIHLPFVYIYHQKLSK